jgi:phytoene dehydrogenase-like protein
MAKSYDAVVIGAGHNGLVAAAYLGKAGKSVLLLERRPVVGGAAVTEEFHPGFRVSSCAHLAGLLHPRIVRELELPRFGLDLLTPEAACFVPVPGGKPLTLWRSKEKALEALGHHSPRDKERYPAFARLVERLGGFARSLLLKPPLIPEPAQVDITEALSAALRMRWLGRKDLHQALRVMPMSVADLLNEWFEAKPLQAMFAARAINGAFLAPRSGGTASLLLLSNAAAPGWPLLSWALPRGGMGAVASAMAAAATRHGVEIRTEASVARIRVERARAVGVALESGEEIDARVVVSNADPRTTFAGLVDTALLEPDFVTRIRNIKFRGVVAKVNLALDALPRFDALPADGPSPEHQGIIQIAPEMDYLERAFDDAKYGRASTRPFLEIVIPSVLDPSLAPQGKHVMSILVQYAPYHLREGDWSRKGPELGENVLKTLSEYSPGIASLVLHQQILTPLDLETVYGLPEGNVHHGEHTLDQLFFMRPVPGWAHYRTPIRNLYLCGAGSHPGGGVSGAPGHNASRQILKDEAKAVAS